LLQLDSHREGICPNPLQKYTISRNAATFVAVVAVVAEKVCIFAAEMICKQKDKK